MCITSSCSNWENATFIYTQWCLMTMFMFSNSLHRQYLWGGLANHGLDKNELLLKRAQGSNDLAKLAIVVANYTSRSSFTNCLPHLKGEKVFGFAKRLIDCLPCVEEDSHCLDHVNFSHPWVFVPTIEPNIVEDIHVQ